jgi:hypothetical protein
VATLTAIVWLLSIGLSFPLRNILKNYISIRDAENLNTSGILIISFIIGTAIYSDIYGKVGPFIMLEELKWWLISGFVAPGLFTLPSFVLPALMKKTFTTTTSTNIPSNQADFLDSRNHIFLP